VLRVAAAERCAGVCELCSEASSISEKFMGILS
jgi:hypothetical protein